MRIIKFRGKSVKTGEWLYGNIQVPTKEGVPYFMWDCDHNQMEVFSETISQFTGLLDENGKDIYEGDIIKDNNEFPFNGNYIVTWDNYYSRFQCNSTKTDGYLCLHDFAKPIVIGNIYDNPEIIVPTLQ